MFITFEGIDGSGKTSQMERLAESFRGRGLEVVVTRNPGGTDIGQELRQILLHHPGFVSERCELLLYLADRAQHVDEVVRPALAKGQIVLCDRYIDSTVAYQGAGRKLPLEDIHRLNALATDNLKPDKTFLFDAPVDILLHRAQKRSDADRLEQEAVDFYERVREQYLNLARREPERFILIDASKSFDEVHQDLLTQAIWPQRANV